MNCSNVCQALLLLIDDADFPSTTDAALVTRLQSIGQRRTKSRVADLTTHLATCAQCRRYLADLRQTQTMLQQSHPPEFSPMYLDDFTQRVLRQLPPRYELWTLLRHWFLQLEQSPLPIVARAVAVLGTASLLALKIPGVESAVRILIGM